MSLEKPPKNIRRALKGLSRKVYEIELRMHLGKLYDNFKDWDSNKLSSAELCDYIHEFHHGPSREMFNFYNRVDADMAVGRGIVLKYITLGEIPEEVHPYLSNGIEFYNRQYNSK